MYCKGINQIIPILLFHSKWMKILKTDQSDVSSKHIIRCKHQSQLKVGFFRNSFFTKYEYGLFWQPSWLFLKILFLESDQKKRTENFFTHTLFRNSLEWWKKVNMDYLNHAFQNNLPVSVMLYFYYCKSLQMAVLTKRCLVLSYRSSFKCCNNASQNGGFHTHKMAIYSKPCKC